jgi:hypothetical protein
MSLPSDTWITTEDHAFGPTMDQKILPSGSFVRPIAFCYLPEEIRNKELDKVVYSRINLDNFVFCYTHYGIIVISRDILRKI